METTNSSVENAKSPSAHKSKIIRLEEHEHDERLLIRREILRSKLRMMDINPQ